MWPPNPCILFENIERTPTRSVWTTTSGTLFIDTISEEFTAAMLESIAANKLASMSEPANWNSSSIIWPRILTATFRNMSADETRLDLQKTKYRVGIRTKRGNIYRLTWIERFTPEDGGTHVDTVRTSTLTGDGGTVYANEYTVEPPSTDGTNTIIVASVRFEIQSSDKINYGFDPMGSEPWTSVCVGSTNDIVRFAIHPALVRDVELVVASGGIDVTPKTFTTTETNLTIYGSTSGNGVIEARLKSSGTVIARLNVMVLPKQTLSVGIYRVEDPQSSDTRPVWGPTDDQIITTLNDIYKQACIVFTNANASTQLTNIVYDVYSLGPGGILLNSQDGKLQDAEIDAVSPTNTAWQGKIKVFLFKNSGHPYPTNPSFNARGWTPPSHLYSVVFTSALTPNTIAHEFGHQLNLPFRRDGEGGHDGGRVPSGTEHLMKSGAPVNGVWPYPSGRWLRQQDWRRANDNALEK